MINFDSTPKRANRDTVHELGRFELKGNKMVPVLADTIPPVEPPAPAQLAQPRAHDVVAWYHDGRVTKTHHATKEAAQDYAESLHWALVYKFMIMCGRQMVARKSVEVPS